MSRRSKILYSLCIDFLVILILVSIYMIYYFYTIKDSDVETKALLINEKNTMSYKVSMLDGTSSYVTSKIDDINTNFSYSISFDNEIDGQYSYLIKGYLVGYNGDKIVLNREIFNSTLKKFSVKGNVINVADSINIDFDKQYQSYLNYLKTYTSVETSYIMYDIEVFYNVKSEYLNKSIVDTKKFYVRATLNDNISTIGVTPNEDIDRKIFSDINYEKKPIYLVVCLEFMGVILLCVFVIIYIVRIIRKNESDYDKYKNYILRKYDSKIVSISVLPDLKKLQVLFVDSMGDLIDAANTLNLPINYIEVVKGHEAVFIILNKRTAYVYKINDDNVRD